MPGIDLGLVFGYIEFAAEIFTFKNFIYVMCIRAGDIMMYTNSVVKSTIGQQKIKDLMIVHAFDPGTKCLAENGMFTPWAVTGFSNFYASSRHSTEAYHVR